MATVKQRFHKYTVNGITYYETVPDYNLPAGSQGWVDDPAEIQQELTKWQGKTDEWSQGYVKNLQKGIRDVTSGESPWALDPQGVLTTKKALESQAEEQRKLASGQYRDVNAGTGKPPLLVPIGSAGDLNLQNPVNQPTGYQGNNVPLANGGQNAVSGGQSSYTGVSIVDYLKSVGQASDYASRANLAKQLGIQNYTGTAQQNTQLLSILRGQGGQAGQTPTPTGTLAGGASGAKPTYQESVSGMNLPTESIPTPGTGGVAGTIGYGNAQMATQDQYIRDLQAQQQAAMAQQQQQTSPWRALITGSQTPAQVANEAMATTGIDISQYFAESRAAIAELEALNTAYNNKVAERDQAVLNSANKLAPMTFIRGEQALIQNQYAIELNRQSSNINSKAAIYEAKQGRFQEAQTYVQNAVAAATAEQKYNMDMYQFFYNENQDIINGLDADIRNALNQSMTQARWEYEQATQAAQQKIDNDFKQQGINIDLMQETRLGAEQATGLSITQKSDFAEDLAYIASLPSKEEMNKWLTQNKTALISKYGQDNYNIMLQEPERLFPQTPTEPTATAPPVFGTGRFANVSLDEEIKRKQEQNIKFGVPKNTGLREELVRDQGYDIREVDRRLNPLGTILTDVGSFFINLFGG